MGLAAIAGLIVIAWGAVAALVALLTVAAGRADRSEARQDAAFAASIPSQTPARVRRQRAVAAARSEQQRAGAKMRAAVR